MKNVPMNELAIEPGYAGAECVSFPASYWRQRVLESNLDTPPDDALAHLGLCRQCQRLVDQLLHESFSSIMGRPPQASAPTPSATTTQTELVNRLKSKIFQELSQSEVPSDQRLETIGRYRVVQKLAHGGMGQVFQCRDDLLGRDVAVKLFSEIGCDTHLRQRMHREAKLQASISHPNIVRLYEVNTDSVSPFLVMELMRGGSLKALKQAGPMPPQRAAAYVEAIARAVHHAQQQGVLHRDLKPSNILIESPVDPAEPYPEHLSLKVADFGLAKAIGSASDLTATNVLVGTPAYMSPEQSEGIPAQVGPATDIYALGAILYDLLVGRAPILADDIRLTLAMIRETPPISPRVFQPNLSRDLETICLKCLEKSPARRYDTALGLAEDLRRFLENKPIKARPVPGLLKAWLWCSRNRKLAVAYLLAVVSTIGMAVGGTVLAMKRKEFMDDRARAYSKAKEMALEALTSRDLRDRNRGRVEMDFFHSMRTMHSQFQNVMKTTPPGPFLAAIQKIQEENRGQWIAELKLLQSRINEDFQRPEDNIQLMGFLASLLRESGEPGEAIFWADRVIQAALNFPAGQKAQAATVEAIYTAALASVGPDNARRDSLQKLYQAWPPGRTEPNATPELQQLRQKLGQALGVSGD